MVKRAIDSKWNRANQTQQRPRSHTLTHVFENTLDDMVSPAHIVAKRIRVRIDGSKLFKIFLDEKDRLGFKSREFMQARIEPIAALYKKVTTRDIVFEFKAEQAFFMVKK